MACAALQIGARNIRGVARAAGLAIPAIGDDFVGLLAAARSVPMDRSLRLAATVSVAMVVAVLAAATLGGSLPILFKKLKLDPALMSGPFITSIVDIISLLVYLHIAVMIFK